MSSTEGLSGIADCVFQHAIDTPDRLAMSCELGEFTYAELAQRVNQIASAFLDLDVCRGDRVAVITTPRSDAYSVFIALNAIGAIWVGINPVYQYDEMSYVVGDAQPVLLVYLSQFGGRDYHADATRLADEHDCIRQLVCLDDAVEQTPSLVSLMAAAADAPIPQVIAEDIAMIVYTSGSTGEPKGCMLANRAMIYRAGVQWDNLQVRDYPRVYCPLPLNHVGGMQMVAGATLIAGGTVNFREKFNPAAVGGIVRDNKVNFIVLFPTMYQLIADDPAFDPRDFDSLECINFSGGVISRELLDVLLSLGKGVVQTCFGSTETCIGVIFSEPGLAPEVLAESVGRPIQDDCRVVDESGKVCEVGKIGEFQVIRDYCMSGYFNRPQATCDAFTDDGYLRTGDLVEVLPDGSFKFSARRSDMYKSGGYNVYPREVEIVLERHTDIISAAVCGVPDGLYSEVGYAYLMIPEGRSLSYEEVKAWCAERLSNYKIPKMVECIREMPLLPNGKLDKKTLKKRAAASVAG